METSLHDDPKKSMRCDAFRHTTERQPLAADDGADATDRMGPFANDPHVNRVKCAGTAPNP